MKWLQWRIASVVLFAFVAGCAPAGQSAGPRGADMPDVAPEKSRTLVAVVRNEPSIMSRKFPNTGSNAQVGDPGLFHADLFRFDEHRNPLPYLVEALPQLNTDTWRVFPDGRMETTYVLKPNLTWHDGAPLTASDYVFAWRVYTTSELGWRPMPQNLMEEVVARDPRTVVIRWRKTYPGADSLSVSDFPAIPRHILEEPFTQNAPNVFMSHPYWTTQWVGLGPYKLDRWEPGAFIEGAAFDGFVFGRPKIDRVRMIFINDANTVVANLLAGAADLTLGDGTISFQQGVLLKREWAPRNGGSVTMTATEVRFMHVQHRPDVVNPPAIADVRVRQAIAHAIDKQALNDGLLDGEGRTADTLLPLELYTPAVERVTTKYAYDPRRTEQLLTSAGFAKSGDGFFANATGGRFNPEIRAIAGKLDESEQAILIDGFRRAGIDAPGYIVPAAQNSDGQIMASFPALFTGKSGLDDGDGGLDKLLSVKAPKAENRWSGSALGGYANSEYDRLYEVFTTTLSKADRDQAVLSMTKMTSEELPAIPMYANFAVSAHVAALRGPREGLTPNGYIHEWQILP